MRKKKCFIFNCLKVYSFFYLLDLYLCLTCDYTSLLQKHAQTGWRPGQVVPRLLSRSWTGSSNPLTPKGILQVLSMGVWVSGISLVPLVPVFFPISRNVFCHVTELPHPDGLALYTIINICHSSESLCPLTVLCFHTEPAQAINLSWQRELNIKSFFCYGENM